MPKIEGLVEDEYSVDIESGKRSRFLKDSGFADDVMNIMEEGSPFQQRVDRFDSILA